MPQVDPISQIEAIPETERTPHQRSVLESNSILLQLSDSAKSTVALIGNVSDLSPEQERVLMKSACMVINAFWTCHRLVVKEEVLLSIATLINLFPDEHLAAPAEDCSGSDAARNISYMLCTFFTLRQLGDLGKAANVSVHLGKALEQFNSDNLEEADSTLESLGSSLSQVWFMFLIQRYRLQMSLYQTKGAKTTKPELAITFSVLENITNRMDVLFATHPETKYMQLHSRMAYREDHHMPLNLTDIYEHAVAAIEAADKVEDEVLQAAARYIIGYMLLQGGHGRDSVPVVEFKKVVTEAEGFEKVAARGGFGEMVVAGCSTARTVTLKMKKVFDAKPDGESEAPLLEITSEPLPGNDSCHHCHLQSDLTIKTQKLLKCGQCGCAYYCSKECQKMAWKTHRAHCVVLKQRAQARETNVKAG
ncbi:hypothetical protein CYMTET_19702 [Cymbomonas tetramitiformis]|uniref:MYND-type domain-containing protein n=1 Tax=Cymbomonas tetramitiformis TaxID=36881 RepID=A0AAE0G5G4_9CHLO|nr:hypothetical protein CYMTET_21209 [Cymbomonas tetramitiformis]KAK3271975.1 hypothetical protein CYMTET_19702 [Cymbomonas tetramitiformis]